MATSKIQQVTNNSGSGYCKMPDGTLIQWGTTVLDPTTSAGVQTVTVTLPVAFANPYYSVTMSWYDNMNTVASYFDSLGASSANNDGKTRNTFTIAAKRKDPLYSWQVCWLAIGRWK